MDEPLRRRLDAIVVLLAVIAVLLAGVVVGLGGLELLVKVAVVGALLGHFCWTVWNARTDRNPEQGTATDGPGPDSQSGADDPSN